MKRIFWGVIIFLVLSALGPLIVVLKDEVDFSSSDPKQMSNISAQISPDPKNYPQAIIQVFSARIFNWRGPFAVHTWISVKPENAQYYTVYQVIGSRRFEGLSLVSIEPDLPDRYWFGNKPELLLTITGVKAQALIPQIDKAAKDYIYTQDYHYWPGPNSNTFIAAVAKQVPDLRLALPGNAIGKDYLPLGQLWTFAPSGTGYQISIGGVLSLMLAKEEGVEINIVGLVYGLSPKTRTLKWPGVGDIKL